MHDTIDVDLLAHVTGGIAAAPACEPQQPQQPPQQMPPGGPKYSAAWWDVVRARGGDR